MGSHHDEQRGQRATRHAAKVCDPEVQQEVATRLRAERGAEGAVACMGEQGAENGSSAVHDSPVKVRGLAWEVSCMHAALSAPPTQCIAFEVPRAASCMLQRAHVHLTKI